jgi:chromosome segregation ATPase
VKGVYGYLIDYLKIDKNISFAYEIAGISKLCTLLVEDDKVASQVIDINRKMKGKNISIMPLSFVKSQIS